MEIKRSKHSLLSYAAFITAEHGMLYDITVVVFRIDRAMAFGLI